MNGDDCTQAISELSVLPPKIREKASACAAALDSDEKRDRLVRALQAASTALNTMDAQEEALLHMMQNLEHQMRADIRKQQKEELGEIEEGEDTEKLEHLSKELEQSDT